MRFWNHYRTACVDSSNIHYPETESDLIALVKQAAQEKKKFRVMGACHSQMGIMFGDGINASMARYNKVIAVNNNHVTLQAGITIAELNNELEKHNLSLSNMTSSGHPTFIGAMLTGSHGGSKKFGCMASMVVSIRLIKSDGSILEINRDDKLFNAMPISFGALGVVSSVTIECLTGHCFTSLRQPMKFNDFLKNWADIAEHNDYVRCLWYPITGDMEIWTANRSSAPVAECCDNKNSADLHRVSKIDQLIAPIAIFVVSYFRSLQMALTKMFIRKDVVSFQGTANKSFCMDDGGNPLFYEAGPAVDFNDTLKVLTALQKHFEDTNNYPIFPIEFRPTAADNFWMSPAYKRNITSFALLAHRNGKDDHAAFYASMATLFAPYQYRVHWGMQIIGDRQYLAEQYAHWDDFIQLKQKLDPDNMFSQKIFDQLFTKIAKPLQRALDKAA